MWLRVNPPRALFLDLPVPCEEYLRSVTAGESLERAVEGMKEEGLIKEPHDSQSIRALLPLLKAIPELGCEVYCYRDLAYHYFLREHAEELLLLALRARLSGVRAEEWRRAIREEVEFEMRAASREAEYIATRAAQGGTCFNASSEVEGNLRKRGFEIRRVVIDEPRRPLDVLRMKIKEELFSGKQMRDAEIVELVKEHLRFLRLVETRGYEEACEAWSKSNF